MNSELDTWVAAERLIAEHGGAAERKVRERVRELTALGDHEAATSWELVRETIRELRRGAAVRN